LDRLKNLILLYFSERQSKQINRMKKQKSSLPPAGLPAGANLINFSPAKRLAARFGTCSKTIFRWADRGFFGRYKINQRVVLFDIAEVLAYVQSTRVN
jgi:hypothetical protein